jgi:hypothetical protein
MPSALAMALLFHLGSLITINVDEELRGQKRFPLRDVSRSRPTTMPCGAILADARAMAIRPTAQKALLA